MCLLETLTKEGGGRPNGRPAPIRTNDVCLPEALKKEGGGRPNGRPAPRRTKNVCLPGALPQEELIMCACLRLQRRREVVGRLGALP